MREDLLRLAISGTEFLENESVSALLSMARRLDVSAVELWYPRNFVHDGEASTIRRVIAAGIAVAAVSCGVEVVELDDVEGTRQKLLRAIEVAAELDAPFVNTYFGAPDYRDDSRAINTFVRNVDPCLTKADRLGRKLLLENEFNAFGRDAYQGDITRRPASLRRLLEYCGKGRLNLTFDPANFYCAGIEPYPLAYSLLADHIAYVHVKDVAMFDTIIDGYTGQAWRQYYDYDRQYVTRPLGAGALNWSGLLRELAQLRWSGFLTAEPHAKREYREAAFTQSINWLRTELDWSGRATDSLVPG